MQIKMVSSYRHGHCIKKCDKFVALLYIKFLGTGRRVPCHDSCWWLIQMVYISCLVSSVSCTVHDFLHCNL